FIFTHCLIIFVFFFFFFSSRRRHTRFKCDWSSDVCSSDLQQLCLFGAVGVLFSAAFALFVLPLLVPIPKQSGQPPLWLTRLMERSEERRVGKECRSRWERDRDKKKKK